MMTDNILTALYETKRQGFLLGFMQYPKNFDAALAYAYYNRIAPLLHEEIMRESYNGSDPFTDVYTIKAGFVEEVLEYIDSCNQNQDTDALGFYKLEEKFGGYKSNRIELIHTIEYFRIDGRFDDSVYSAIEANAPSEANQLKKDFSPDNCFFG